jgi:DNA-binding IclR family transcriptional regulator
MLRRILSLLESGETRTLVEFAHELGVDRAAVEEMLMRLCALGYVEELAASLSAACGETGSAACAGCSGCSFGRDDAPQGRVWSLTEKGRRALAAG